MHPGVGIGLLLVLWYCFWLCAWELFLRLTTITSHLEDKAS
jgi:hypothetical protein